MTEFILTTYDWVPEMPRGYVRDLRVRWALEEAGMRYRVESTPFRARNGVNQPNLPQLARPLLKLSLNKGSAPRGQWA